MSKTSNLEISKNHITAIVMGVVMCFLSFVAIVPAVQAEEVTSDETSSQDEIKSAMKAQIESLRATIAERKAAMEAKREEMKVERSEMKDEFKEQRQLDKAAFFTSLEGMSEEEKKAAMLDFIAQIKEQIEARKALMTQHQTEMKVMREEAKTDREAMRSSLLERIAELRAKLSDRLNDSDSTEDEAVDESDDSDESEEVDDESDDSQDNSEELDDSSDEEGEV